MIEILDEMKNDFLVYAAEVNNNRSFCDARDGLKPAQRAALYTMYNKGFSSNKPHVKSAKVSGAIIAELWPHSDAAAYESFVRMSQNWINNIPEVDWHGGNGSQLGGPEAASSRYTECRLSKASEDGFFMGIKKDSVDMIPNFSEDMLWPSVFPAIFPRLMTNGSQGIGYTIAQEWEPHNINEIFEKVKEYVATGKVSISDIYPDFPTGGIIINKKDLHSLYETGKGTVILRGRAEIDGNIIKITELPYQVYAEPFIQKVKDLVNSDQLTGIEDICNKSDDSGLLIEIECSGEKIDAGIVLKKLYKLTDLQTTFSANQMALVDGIPQMLNLQDYIKVYVDHNLTCLQREYKFDLDKATARKEIVDGLTKALSIIDNIIATIKKSKSADGARQDLVNTFNFTDNQARAIVDMKLGKLANLEQEELTKELDELNKTVDSCTKFLASDKLQKKEFINRLTDFVNKYGWERRTEVIDVDLEVEKAEVKVKMPKAAEYFNLVLENNHLKKLNNDSIKKYLKATPDAKYITLAKTEQVILISNRGTFYKLPIKKLDICSPNATGTDLTQFFNEKIIAIFSGNEAEEFMFFITKNGLAKKTAYADLASISKKIGCIACKVTDDDELIDCRLVNSEVINVMYNNKIKSINTDDFIAKSRTAGGVCAVKTKDGKTITLA